MTKRESEELYEKNKLDKSSFFKTQENIEELLGITISDNDIRNFFKVRDNPNDILNIKNPSEHLLIFAAYLKPALVLSMPEEWLSEDVCCQAIRFNPKIALKLNKMVLTSNMYYEALSGYPAISFFEVPKEYHNKEIAELAAYSSQKDSFGHIRDDLKTDDIIFIALETDPLNLRHVENQTFGMKSFAVKENGKALKYVKNQNFELCQEAVNHTGLALEYVDSKYKTLDLCRTAVKKNPISIQYVPNKFHDQEMCQSAFDRCSETIQFFDIKMITESSIVSALEKKAEILQLIDKKEQKPIFCLTAIKQKPHTRSFIKILDKNKIDNPDIKIDQIIYLLNKMLIVEMMGKSSKKEITD